MYNDLPPWARDTAAGQAMIAEFSQKAAAVRQQLATKLAKLEREREAEQARLEPQVAKARAELDQAFERYKAAQRALSAVAEAIRTDGLNGQIAEVRKQLRKSADGPTIERFRNEWGELAAQVERYKRGAKTERLSLVRRAENALSFAIAAIDLLYEAAELDLTPRIVEIRQRLRDEVYAALPDLDAVAPPPKRAA